MKPAKWIREKQFILPQLPFLGATERCGGDRRPYLECV